MPGGTDYQIVGDFSGKHVLLIGPVGIGKSAILDAAVRAIARRRSDRHQLDPLVEEAPLPDFEHGERRRTQGLILVYYTWASIRPKASSLPSRNGSLKRG